MATPSRVKCMLHDCMGPLGLLGEPLRIEPNMICLGSPPWPEPTGDLRSRTVLLLLGRLRPALLRCLAPQWTSVDDGSWTGLILDVWHELGVRGHIRCRSQAVGFYFCLSALMVSETVPKKGYGMSLLVAWWSTRLQVHGVNQDVLSFCRGLR